MSKGWGSQFDRARFSDFTVWKFTTKEDLNP